MTACGGGTIGYIWVLGTYYSQISGYKIDDYTGNLTPILDQPFSSGGSNPVSIVVKAGGRFVYVLNGGTGEKSTPNSGSYTAPSGAGISEFSVGGGGTLVFEQTFQSQGYHPVWAITDSSGQYLYVLDKYSPAYCAATKCSNTQDTANLPSSASLGQDLNGSITAFSIDGNTGRLTLVENSAILQPNTNIPTTYFEVGPAPVMVQAGGGGCLFTLSPTSIYPYSVNTGTGQLTVTATGSYTVPGGGSVTPNLTSINTTNASFTYLTDAANNLIYSLQAGGTACSLTPISNSQQTNLPGTSYPVNSVTAPSGHFLYVINQNTNGQGTQQNANSSISAFTVNSNGQLQTLSDSNNPYAVGSVPVCIAVDPTKQYLYVSNNSDSTLTGKLVDQNRGYLSDLNRGSVFTVSKNPTCLAISGNI
jgi:6-phosphogluconolactonase (cycloisomerase 2 family)